MNGLAQQLNYPNSETELNVLLDGLFANTKKAIERMDLSRFKGLLEVISSEAVIHKAIKNIKSNKGSKTREWMDKRSTTFCKRITQK